MRVLTPATVTVYRACPAFDAYPGRVNEKCVNIGALPNQTDTRIRASLHGREQIARSVCKRHKRQHNRHLNKHADHRCQSSP